MTVLLDLQLVLGFMVVFLMTMFERCMSFLYATEFVVVDLSLASIQLITEYYAVSHRQFNEGFLEYLYLVLISVGGMFFWEKCDVIITCL